MIKEYRYNSITWVDLENPTSDDVRAVRDKYKIHALVAEELLIPTVRSKVEQYEDFVYLVMHFPIFLHKHGRGASQEIDFIIGHDFIITNHYEEADPILEFSRIFETESMLNKANIGDSAGLVFFYLMKHIYGALHQNLEHFSDRLDRAEEKIFTGHEAAMVKHLSDINRHLMDFKQAVSMHQTILESFEAPAEALFGRSFNHYIRNIIGEYHKVSNTLSGLREMLKDLRETNDSLLTTKTNEIMKTLTIMAFITMPSSLIAAIFTIPTSEEQLFGTGYDFIFIIGIMIIVTASLVVFFKHRRWL